MESNIDMNKWIGKSIHSDDKIVDYPIKAMAAVFNYEYNKEEFQNVPYGWHWLYFLNLPLQKNLGPDGHEKKQGFMPPIPLPIRMYAGGEITYYNPLVVGKNAKKTSKIISILNKEGSSGKLIFLQIKHRILSNEELILEELQNLVYREEKKDKKNTITKFIKSPDYYDFQKSWHTTPEMLFRYSALTHNTHRIHYDYPYATNVEGYPQIVVHGPLMATFLLDLAAKISKDKEKKIKKFNFRLMSPVFVGGKIIAEAKNSTSGLDLWIKDQKGNKSLSAEAELSN